MMIKENYNVIGVMSGTSLDGVDLAHIQFSIIDGIWQFKILEAQTVAYSDDWVEKLKNALNLDATSLSHLNNAYTITLASIIKQFITTNKLHTIDAVCSHGHTILHQPHKGITLQIGNQKEIALLIDQTVVCDFRVDDVALGGQGAPLVPIGDQKLFNQYDYCMNLGGFSNISYTEDGNQIAYDICAVNTVLNFYANQLNLPYDEQGKIARQAKVDTKLLQELSELDYYKIPHPKSLGYEFVQEIAIPLIEAYSISIEDKIATFTHHIAQQIAAVLPNRKAAILITGGGAYNRFLIEKLQEKLPLLHIVIPDRKTIEFKEALIFGFLGVLKLRDEINVLKSVTGARRDHSSGRIYLRSTSPLEKDFITAN